MDVVLGVAVTGPIARLALVGTGAEATAVIDQSVVDLANDPIEQLRETVVGTNRLLAGENHRLVGTRVCWTDHPQADQLRRALEDSGVHNVAVLSESQAVKALMRAAGRPGSALLFDDATATLSLVDSAEADDDAPPTLLAQGSVTADATAALDTMMARIGEAPDAPQDVLLVGASGDLDRVAEQLRESSTMRVQIPEDPTFALARGAAMAAAALGPDATAMAPALGLTGDETAMAPAAGLDPDATTIVPAEAQAADAQLAYSLAAEDEADLPPGDLDEFDDYYDSEAETGPLKLSRRSLLVGNAVIAFAVIGVASLAVAVAVAVRPTASAEPVIGHQNAAPGKFMPLLPTQQQAPVPPPSIDAPNAGYQGGTIPAPAAPPAPVAPITPGAPGVPGAPGFVPNPNPLVPIPVPIIVPYPGWRPQPPPYWPPYYPTTPTWTTPTTPTTPTTTTTIPTTTTTIPTTTSTPTTSSTPTTTQTTPTTETTQTTTPHTSSSTPTTTVAPTTTQYTPLTPTTTVAPTTVPTTAAPTTVAPTTKAPTQPTVAPTQPTITAPHTQATVPKPVVPQQPHSHSGF
ncbi:hypothetical protein MRAB57_796 [Mycobacterium rhizamassiliense]|jgi:hypothetical protein|uniref:DUF7159 domain-containing protein n=1 Tax=Mycobacterium rhizamassiliense TaxID=1841860 RepID=A0A2U3NNJ1_9MYCO|nr:hypothetical protein [Mycobacterium rhizamassiliense]SPM32993.1 hypothetical protein MRAB57_796 [Mycobacterium rhizamassiliense]